MLCTPARQLQGMRLLVLCLLACGLWHAAGSARSSKPRTGGLGAERDSDKILSGDPAGRGSLGDVSSVAEMLLTSMDFVAATLVDVVLVGFNSDGNGGVTLLEEELHRHLTVLRHDHQRAHTLRADARGSHDLSVRHLFMYRVTHADRSVIEELNEFVRERVVVRGESFLPTAPVDALLRKRVPKDAHRYTVFVLNPVLPPPVVDDATGRRTQHVYWYLPDVRGAGRACGVTLWAGEERMMWVDVTAGPAMYGPATHGTGMVTEYDIPRVRPPTVTGGQRAGPSTDARVPLPADFVPGLAAFLHRTTLLQLAPPLSWLPARAEREVEVAVVFVHERDPPPSPEQLLQEWARVRDDLASLALPNHTVAFSAAPVALASCELCVAALQHSVRERTSVVVGVGLGTQEQAYLDSTEMHRWLQSFDDKYWRVARDASRGRKIVPVFVFELKRLAAASQRPLLLDRQHQAVAFPDMAIAVVSPAAPTALTDLTCNGNRMVLEVGDAQRAVLAAALQTVWGVAPPHIIWNALRRVAETDYLWAPAPNPFSSLAWFARYPSRTDEPRSLLPPALRDVALRNVVYREVNDTLKALRVTLAHLQDYGASPVDLLSAADYAALQQAWRQIRRKLDHAASSLLVLDHAQAMHHVREAQGALLELRALVQQAGMAMQPVLTCDNDAFVPSPWLLLAAAAASSALMASSATYWALNRKETDAWRRTLPPTRTHAD